MDKPWTRLILDLLADNEWHDYQEVMNKAAVLVTESQGFKVGEYYRKYKYTHRDREVPVQSNDAQLATTATGQRMVVQRSMTKLRNRRMVEVELVAQGKHRNKPVKIRLNPDWIDCEL